ncbi:MAG: phosphatase PAP2 family protein [Verrucomicrobiales bacterium]|nr:phosphatase PAP2 family protein [Verrucomicrobiales bacterium]
MENRKRKAANKNIFSFLLSVFSILLFVPLLPRAFAAAPPDYFQRLAESDYHYLNPAKFHIERVLAPPPADDSLVTEAELAALLELQRLRSATEVLRARAGAALTPDAFTDAVGPWYQPDRLPLTMTLLQRVKDDCYKSVPGQKKQWPRARPYHLDPRLAPCVDLPGNASYPSGHAELGALWGAVLASVAPAGERARLLARGWEIGDDRLLAGVHYPSDVAAGRLVARELFRLMQASPKFRRDRAAARKEIENIQRGNAAMKKLVSFPP